MSSVLEQDALPPAVREACEGPADAAPESAVLPAVATVHRGVLPRPQPRRFAVVSDEHGYFVEGIWPGVVSAIESPEGRAAPVGSVVVTDLDAERGWLVAERGLHGWTVVP